MKTIIVATIAALLVGCLPSVQQTTWSAQPGAVVTLTAERAPAQAWVQQCRALRNGGTLPIIGALLAGSASGAAAGASMAADNGGTMLNVGAAIGAAVTIYLGVRSWYSARLYSSACMAWDGAEKPRTLATLPL
jgi:hypothetical protein